MHDLSVNGSSRGSTPLHGAILLFMFHLKVKIMTKLDVTEKRVIKDGKLALRLTWWKNGIFDHVEYVTDKELIY
jgi:hypothetical protein